jgi:hypothetical protein
MQFRVSVMHPHTIVAVECSGSSILGHTAADLLGSILSIFAGPKTDFEGLLHSVSACAYQEPAETVQHMVLYDVDGVARNLTVSCAHSSSQSCAITLKYTSAITLASVDETVSQPWALVSSDWPHFAESTNDHFQGLFGLCSDDILGQNLHRIKPRHTESTKWRNLMISASHGLRCQETVLTLSASGVESWMDLKCIPVVDAPDCAVRHILVLFSEATSPPTLSIFHDSCSTGDCTSPSGHVPQSHHLGMWPAALPSHHRNPSILPPQIYLPHKSDFHLQLTAAAEIGRPVAQRAAPLIVDEAYVRRVLRRHRAAERRSAAAPPPQLKCAAPPDLIEPGQLGLLSPTAAAAAAGSRCSFTSPTCSSSSIAAAIAVCGSDCGGGDLDSDAPAAEGALDPTPWWESCFPPAAPHPRGVAGGETA